MVAFPLIFYPAVSFVLSRDTQLLSQLSNSNIFFDEKFRVFQDVGAFLKALQNEDKLENPFQRSLSECETIEASLYQITIDLSDIVNYYCQFVKQEQAALALIDYALIKEKFLDNCRILGNRNIQRILLINPGEEAAALEAYNQGLIDQCLHKDHPDFEESVRETIRQAQEKYFRFFSGKLEALMSLNRSSSPVYSSDFISAFYKLLKKYNIKEYYLIGLEGNFLLKDNRQKERLLLTYSLSEIEAFLDSREAEEASSSVLKRIKGKEGLSFSLKGNSYVIPKGEQWEENFHPIYQELKIGNEEYYLFLVDKK